MPVAHSLWYREAMLKSAAATLCALPLLIGLSMAACGGEDAKPDTDDSGDERDAGRRPDASRDAGRPDTGNGQTVPDAAPPRPDAGPSSVNLEALAGRYLMRWDVLGTAKSNFLGGEMRIRSRLSTLVVAELKVEGNKLVSEERVCTQIAAQKCESICDTARTVVDPRTIEDFLKKKKQTREFTVSGDGTFTAERSVAQLGYDDEDLDGEVPTSSDDERVWDVEAGDPREGFLTSITVKALGLGPTCQAFGTQKYVSSFSGKLGGSDDAPTLPTIMALDLLDSAAATLGSSDATCNEQAMMAESPIDEANARMVRYGDDLSEDAFWACPADSVFNEKMPGSEPALDAP
jgi:hypothetical protein